MLNVILKISFENFFEIYIKFSKIIFTIFKSVLNNAEFILCKSWRFPTRLKIAQPLYITVKYAVLYNFLSQ